MSQLNIGSEPSWIDIGVRRSFHLSISFQSYEPKLNDIGVRLKPMMDFQLKIKIVSSEPIIAT